MENKNKIGLFGVFNEVTNSEAYHSYGYVKCLKSQIKYLLDKDVDVLNYKSDLSQYKYIFIDEGVNFINQTWNKIGGDFSKVISNIEKLNKFEGKIFYNKLKCIVDYQHLINKRNLDVTYLDNKKWIGINFLELTNKMVLGDSHSTSVFENGFAINTINGKTLNGFLEEGIKNFIPDNIDTLRLYAGNIDIRFHLHRLNVNLEEFVKRLEQQLNNLNINCEIVQPLFIEDESRKIPGSGQYKKQNFYGTWNERNEIRNKLDILLSDMCRRNDFRYIVWPNDYVDLDGKLKFEYMEPKGSVHLSPKKYLFK